MISQNPKSPVEKHSNLLHAVSKWQEAYVRKANFIFINDVKVKVISDWKQELIKSSKNIKVNFLNDHQIRYMQEQLEYISYT